VLGLPARRNSAELFLNDQSKQRASSTVEVTVTFLIGKDNALTIRRAIVSKASEEISVKEGEAGVWKPIDQVSQQSNSCLLSA
jgi:hypothetical protein